MKRQIMTILVIAGLLVTGCKQEAETSAAVISQTNTNTSTVLATNEPSASTSDSLLVAAADTSKPATTEAETGMTEEEAYQAAAQTCNDQAQESTEEARDAAYNDCMEALGYAIDNDRSAEQ